MCLLLEAVCKVSGVYLTEFGKWKCIFSALVFFSTKYKTLSYCGWYSSIV